MENDFDFLKNKLKEIKEKVDPLILATIDYIKKDTLRKACSHIIVGGKRMRPAMAVWSAASISGEENNALNFAAGIELLSTFTLLHDDIIDHDLVRRGVESVNAKYGEDVALLAGDTLQSLSCKIICESKVLDPKIKVELLDLIADTVRKMCEGEFLDIALQKKEFPVTEDGYIDMINLKTGSLYQAAARGGSIIAQTDQKSIEAFTDYARLFGTSFQIRDDILGLMADEKLLGKSIGSDIKEGKITLPVIHFLRESKESQREEFDKVFSKPVTLESVQKAKNLLESTGSITYSQNKAEDLANSAKNRINDLALSPEYRLLLNLVADYAARREL